ncbi:MAG: hypothetical protein VYA51_12795 [Planctomycetota bacterium]|nr:hypothetical protein [Planctomycetota bacterium]
MAVVSIVGQILTFQNGEGLNMKISIERSLNPEPDECKLSIEGLDPFRARLMGQVFRETRVGQAVTVQLGYDVIPVAAFSGLLETFDDNVPQGPALWTHATAGDAADIFDDVKLPPGLSSNVGLTPLEQINIAMAAMGILPGPSVAPVVAGASPLAQGPFSASGVRRASDLLDAACLTLRCRWWVRDRQLHLARNGLPDPSRLAVIIAPMQPGPRMPGVPLVAPPSFGGGGIMNCTTFMDPTIVPGGQVSYQGGLFRVEHVIHSAETRSTSPWTSSIVGRAL